MRAPKDLPPVEFAPPLTEDLTPPPPPGPAQFSPPPPALQFATLSSVDRFASPAAPDETAVPAWYGLADAPAPETHAPDDGATLFAAPLPAGYPMAYATSPGYPPQPHYVANPQFAANPDSDVFPAAPEVPWVPQHAAPGAYNTGNGGSRGSKVLIGLAVAVGALVVLGIVGAIVTPIFQSQHQKTVARLALLPDTLVDQQKIVSPDVSSDVASQIARLQRAVPDVLQDNAAYYGQGGVPVFSVSAGNLQHPATATEEKSFFATWATTNSISFAPVGSGPFGGWMQCGDSTATGSTVTTCASLDNAAVVVVTAANTAPSQLAIIARQVINTVEIKT